MSDDASDNVDVDDDDGQTALKPSSEDSSWSPEMGDWSSSVSASAASEVEASVESETSFQGAERISIRNNGSSAAASTTAASISSNIKPGAIDDESHSTSVSNWSSSNTTTTTTTLNTSPTPAFKKGQNVFVSVGKADHVAIFDSFIRDETTNRPLLAKVKYSSTLKWDHVFIDQLKPMHLEKDGELITAPYSKRIRQETNRYQPLPGGGTASATESKSSIAASTRGSASTTNSSSSRMGSGRNRKLMHDEKDETLGSKRTRKETNRYQPEMGGRSTTSAEAKSDAGDARGAMSPSWKKFLKRSRQETNRYTPLTGGGASSTKSEVATPSATAAFAAATPNVHSNAEKSNKGKKGRGFERNGKKNHIKAKSLSDDKEKGDVDYDADEDADDDVADDAPVHGYYEVDEILDRRTRDVGSDINGVGMKYIVEYCEFFVVAFL